MDALSSYVPENARVRELYRREQAALHKICRTYGWQSQDLGQDAAHAEAFLQGTAYMFGLPTWHDRRSACIKRSGVQESADMIDCFAAAIMMRYANAFFLRRQVHDTMEVLKVDPNPHATFGDFFQQEGGKLTDLYINAILRRTHAELKVAGFTDRAALKLQGYLIRKTSFYCADHPADYYPDVYPKQQRNHGENPDIAAILDRINTYGETRVRSPLQKSFAERFGSGKASNDNRLS